MGKTNVFKPRMATVQVAATYQVMTGRKGHFKANLKNFSMSTDTSISMIVPEGITSEDCQTWSLRYLVGALLGLSLKQKPAGCDLIKFNLS